MSVIRAFAFKASVPGQDRRSALHHTGIIKSSFLAFTLTKILAS